MFQSLSWYSNYVMYLIDPKIKESLNYLEIFEDAFKKNQIILIFNKIDQAPNKEFFMNDRDIKKFIQKFNIKNIFYVNSIDKDSINNFKKQLFDLIQNDIFNKIFTNIKPDDFNNNPVLFHRAVVDRSKKIGC